MVPQRPAGSYAVPTSARSSGATSFSQTYSFEAIKARLLTKLEDRMDPSASKRMPPTLFRHTIRQQTEQLAEHDGRGLSKPERERLVEEVLAELLGYGPLEELFKDSTVREVMVTGPHLVIARHEMGTWVPTSIRFRDEEHLRTALDRLASHADSVGGVTASVNLFDLKLPNGFRAVGVVPPPALEQSPVVSFIRFEAPPTVSLQPPSGSRPGLGASGSTSSATQPVPGSPTASPRPGSGSVSQPSPLSHHGSEADPLARHRRRITERLTSKFASLGVYDLQKVEITELRKVVSAYITEYSTTENIYLSDADQGRLMLEILTAMHR